MGNVNKIKLPAEVSVETNPVTQRQFINLLTSERGPFFISPSGEMLLGGLTYTNEAVKSHSFEWISALREGDKFAREIMRDNGWLFFEESSDAFLRGAYGMAHVQFPDWKYRAIEVKDILEALGRVKSKDNVGKVLEKELQRAGEFYKTGRVFSLANQSGREFFLLRDSVEERKSYIGGVELKISRVCADRRDTINQLIEEAISWIPFLKNDGKTGRPGSPEANPYEMQLMAALKAYNQREVHSKKSEALISLRPGTLRENGETEYYRGLDVGYAHTFSADKTPRVSISRLRKEAMGLQDYGLNWLEHN